MQTLMNTYSGVEVPIIVPALVTVAQSADYLSSRDEHEQIKLSVLEEVNF